MFSTPWCLRAKAGLLKGGIQICWFRRWRHQNAHPPYFLTLPTFYIHYMTHLHRGVSDSIPSNIAGSLEPCESRPSPLTSQPIDDSIWGLSGLQNPFSNTLLDNSEIIEGDLLFRPFSVENGYRQNISPSGGPNTSVHNMDRPLVSMRTV